MSSIKLVKPVSIGSVNSIGLSKSGYPTTVDSTIEPSPFSSVEIEYLPEFLFLNNFRYSECWFLLVHPLQETSNTSAS